MIKRKRNKKYKKRKNPTDKAKKLAEEIVGGPVKFLGEGTDGEVYNYQNKYAIKIFHKLLKINLKDYIKYNLMLSNHQLIPEIYQITPNYILMEYIDAPSLEKISSRLTKHERIRIYESIKKELRKWHSLNFTHGDLTPKNILILSENKVIFIDFSDRSDLIFDEDVWSLDLNKRNDLNALEYLIKREELGLNDQTKTN